MGHIPTHTPLSEEDRALLYSAQMASVERGDTYLAGTQMPTAEYGWHLADDIVVRDDSGREEPLLEQLRQVAQK